MFVSIFAFIVNIVKHLIYLMFSFCMVKYNILSVSCGEIFLLTFKLTVLFMIGSLTFLAVHVKSSVNFMHRIISDFSIREIYQADGWG